MLKTYVQMIRILLLKNPLLTTKFSELEVIVWFGIRLHLYTVTNTELYNYDISVKNIIINHVKYTSCHIIGI